MQENELKYNEIDFNISIITFLQDVSSELNVFL